MKCYLVYSKGLGKIGGSQVEFIFLNLDVVFLTIRWICRASHAHRYKSTCRIWIIRDKSKKDEEWSKDTYLVIKDNINQREPSADHIKHNHPPENTAMNSEGVRQQKNNIRRRRRVEYLLLRDDSSIHQVTTLIIQSRRKSMPYGNMVQMLKGLGNGVDQDTLLLYT